MKSLVALGLFTIMQIVPNFSFAKNSFLVAPGRVDFDLERPVTQSFIITNNGSKRIRLNISPIYFDIDSKSLAAGQHIKSDVAKIEDLAPYIRISPRTLSLSPGQRRDIRVSLRPPDNLAQGDYRAHLLVKMIEVASVLGNTGTQTGETGVGMRLNLKMETAVAIYGHKGKRKPELIVHCRKHPSKGTLVVDLVNESIWRLDGRLNLSNGQITFNRYFVSLRESKQSINTDITLSAKQQWQLKVFNTEQESLLTQMNCDKRSKTDSQKEPDRLNSVTIDELANTDKFNM